MVPAASPRQRRQSRGLRSFWKCSECRRDKKACLPRERDWENSRKKCSRCETSNWPCGPPSRKRSVNHLPTIIGPAMGSSPANGQLEQVLDLQETSPIMSSIEHGEQSYDEHAGHGSPSDQSTSTVAPSLYTDDQPLSVGSRAKRWHQFIVTTQSESRSLDITPFDFAARLTSSATLPFISGSSCQHLRLGMDFMQIMIHHIALHGVLEKLTPIVYDKDNALGNDRADFNRHTPLQFATVKDDVEGFRTLLKCGARTNILDQDGRSLVALAARCGSHNVIEYMLTKVFQNGMPPKGVKPPLLEAIKWRHLHIAGWLVAYYSHPARYHEFKDELEEGRKEATNRGFMNLSCQIQAAWQANSSLCAARDHVSNLRFDPSMCQPTSHIDHGIPEQLITRTGMARGQDRRFIGAPDLMPAFSGPFSPLVFGSPIVLGEDMTSEALPRLISLVDTSMTNMSYDRPLPEQRLPQQISLANKNPDLGRSQLSTDEFLLQPQTFLDHSIGWPTEGERVGRFDSFTASGLRYENYNTTTTNTKLGPDMGIGQMLG